MELRQTASGNRRGSCFNLSAAARVRFRLREGPAAHATVGLAFLAHAGVVALAALAGVGSGRRAALACVLMVGVGWASGGGAAPGAMVG